MRARGLGRIAPLLLGGVLLSGCGSARLCGGVQCVANAECVDTEEGEVCRCRAGFVSRAERCQPEGPCGRLAAALCRATGNSPLVCAALQEGVATADGESCERRLAEGDLREGIDWIGQIEPMLQRDLPATYRAFLTRSLLDPCGAATELLCSVMRPSERGCGEEAAAMTRDERSCRAIVKGYDGVSSGAPGPAEAGDAGGEGDVAVVGEDVLVHLIPDPANEGTMPPARFRAVLIARRTEIEACYEGAVGSFPGLSGRAVYVVHVGADGVVTVALGRADGPIRGSGVADCVLQALLMMDFSGEPPEGGTFSVHVAFDFGP